MAVLNEITITVEADKHDHQFNYLMKSDWLDVSIVSDSRKFAEREALPWMYPIAGRWREMDSQNSSDDSFIQRGAECNVDLLCDARATESGVALF